MVTRLKNMPLNEGNITRSKRCNLITFICDGCGETHTIERCNVFVTDDGAMFCVDSLEKCYK